MKKKLTPVLSRSAFAEVLCLCAIENQPLLNRKAHQETEFVDIFLPFITVIRFFSTTSDYSWQPSETLAEICVIRRF